MDFRLFGPIHAVSGGQVVDLGRRRERVLLALLLWHAGETVGVERIVDVLFGDAEPPNPRKALQVHVSRLRRVLAGADPDVRLHTVPGGYRLDADPASVDVHRFTRLVEQGRRCTDLAQRRELLDDAVELRVGPPCADAGAERLREHLAARLDEEYLSAVELRVDTDLALGRHAELIAELAELTAAHPTRERLLAARMLALHRAGRRADALDVYRMAAAVLAAELGIDPGPELRRLHSRVLRDDPALDWRPGQAGAPAQLPAGSRSFTGRESEIETLLAVRRSGSGAVIITAIDGMAGVGKTTLAVHLGHRLAADYPDGQLFLDLRGYTKGAAPAEPSDVLEDMLHALGVPPEQVPPGLDARAALFRSRVASKKVLVVLDNAATEDQVRPLLPGSPHCLAVITSRRALIGLEHAVPLALDVLRATDAAALFRTVAGPARFADEPNGVLDEVVELCGRLPLALHLAAARFRSRPSWHLHHLAQRLRDEQSRLAELSAGERSVAAAIQLSYLGLPPTHRRALRLLAVQPGLDVDLHAAAALTDTLPDGQLSRVLDNLVNERLLTEHQPGRYRFHDLVRLYVLTRVAAAEPGNAALVRLLDHYLGAADAAADLLDANRRRPDDEPPPPTTLTLTDYNEAIGWLDTERPNLLAAVTAAHRDGCLDHAWRLAHALHWFFFQRGHLDNWISTHRIAVAAARAAGHRVGEGETLNALGTALWMSVRFTEAVDVYQQALAIRRELGDRRGEAAALSNLGSVHEQLGKFTTAVEYQHAALRLFAEIGDLRGQANTLGGLGSINERLRNYPEALDNLREALPLFHRTGDLRGQANVLGGMGSINERLGNRREALENAQEALPLFQRIEDLRGQAHTLNVLGTLQREAGSLETASRHHHEALLIADQVGDPMLRCEILNAAGLTAALDDQPDTALRLHDEARVLAERSDNRYELAHAHDGLARSHPDAEQAERHRHTADALFAELGIETGTPQQKGPTP